jgi:osmotically-inducible protein OsmY
MARAAWAVVGVGVLVISYVACQNTWRGMKQDARENAALAKQKAQDVDLGDTARNVRDEAREAARQAGDGLKKMADKLRPGDEVAPPADVAPTSAPSANGERPSSREVDDAIGKVAAKTKETGEEIGGRLKSAAVHLEVEKALARETGLDASRIDVEADEETRTIVLRGSVPDEAQKASAGRIAAERAPGYEIRNELAAVPAVRP